MIFNLPPINLFYFMFQDTQSALVNCVGPQVTITSNWTRLIMKLLSNSTEADRLKSEIKSTETKPIKDDVTLVTSYFDLGDFAKGSESNHFNKKLYKNWMTIFSKISNPVIAWFDQQQDANDFKKIRSSLPENRTIVHVIKRNETWVFNNLYSKIEKLYNRSDYPKFLPNTVKPEYPCVMHLKYELLLRGIYQNPFNTLYMAWLDVGYFRDLVNSNSTEPFELYIPSDMNQDKVSYNMVANREENIEYKHIFLNNIFWVGGGYFVGRVSVMMRWVIQYLSYVDYFLCEDLMNTDQQIIYAMSYVATESLPIQEYHSDGNYWFYLGYLCKDAGAKRAKSKNNTYGHKLL